MDVFLLTSLVREPPITATPYSNWQHPAYSCHVGGAVRSSLFAKETPCFSCRTLHSSNISRYFATIPLIMVHPFSSHRSGLTSDVERRRRFSSTNRTSVQANTFHIRVVSDGFNHAVRLSHHSVRFPSASALISFQLRLLCAKFK